MATCSALRLFIIIIINAFFLQPDRHLLGAETLFLLLFS
tara:strand:+ start:222 stop:338 length:117 start_codon:yes stop_codon:yes gene_type:complete